MTENKKQKNEAADISLVFFHERRENNNVKHFLWLIPLYIQWGAAVNDYDKEFTNCSQGYGLLPLDD